MLVASECKIRELGKDSSGWSDYVARSAHASIYHGLEWREIIERSFRHRSHYLIAQEESGAVRGVLPLFEMRSRLFGHFFVSLPFVNYGGILADTPETELELAQAAAGLAQARGASHIELRQSFAQQSTIEGWTLRQHKAALLINLEGGSKPLWDALSSRLRGKVRKAEKNAAVFSAGGKQDLADFYFLYALNMRDLGTPVYHRRFFENVLDLSPDVQILMVRREGRPAAGAIALRKGNRIELPWICQNYAEAAFNVNEYLYWKGIEWACEQGAGQLDLGRSSIDAGTYRFKVQWNPEPRPLYWYYWTAPGAALPQLNPDNPKYALAVKYWKKLPLGIANRIGPPIVRNIP